MVPLSHRTDLLVLNRDYGPELPNRARKPARYRTPKLVLPETYVSF